jgi:hypothetical protein
VERIGPGELGLGGLELDTRGVQIGLRLDHGVPEVARVDLHEEPAFPDLVPRLHQHRDQLAGRLRLDLGGV